VEREADQREEDHVGRRDELGDAGQSTAREERPGQREAERPEDLARLPGSIGRFGERDGCVRHASRMAAAPGLRVWPASRQG
jgi:hypothetical protein